MTSPDTETAFHVAAIVVAAGSGVRFGTAKQYQPLGNQRVLDWSLQAAELACDSVVLVVSPDHLNAIEPAANCVVAGGATRSASVRAGLEAVDKTADVIVVHDAARPLAPLELFRLVINVVRNGADAAVPGIPVTDTLRSVATHSIKVNREDFVAVQTPQAFRADVLRQIHETENEASDDATLVDTFGGTVVVVPGSVRNRKITEPDDLVIAAALIEAEGA